MSKFSGKKRGKPEDQVAIPSHPRPPGIPKMDCTGNLCNEVTRHLLRDVELLQQMVKIRNLPINPGITEMDKQLFQTTIKNLYQRLHHVQPKMDELLGIRNRMTAAFREYNFFRLRDQTRINTVQTVQAHIDKMAAYMTRVDQLVSTIKQMIGDPTVEETSFSTAALADGKIHTLLITWQAIRNPYKETTTATALACLRYYVWEEFQDSQDSLDSQDSFMSSADYGGGGGEGGGGGDLVDLLSSDEEDNNMADLTDLIDLTD